MSALTRIADALERIADAAERLSAPPPAPIQSKPAEVFQYDPEAALAAEIEEARAQDARGL